MIDFDCNIYIFQNRIIAIKQNSHHQTQKLPTAKPTHINLYLRLEQPSLTNKTIDKHQHKPMHYWVSSNVSNQHTSSEQRPITFEDAPLLRSALEHRNEHPIGDAFETAQVHNPDGSLPMRDLVLSPKVFSRWELFSY